MPLEIVRVSVVGCGRAPIVTAPDTILILAKAHRHFLLLVSVTF